MIISNTQEIPGKNIVEFFGVVSGSTVRAKHIGRDIMAGLKNIVGGELKGFKALVGLGKRRAAHHYAVVFQNDTVAIIAKRFRDLIAV